ncbi:MAG TPA: ABC transporter ATP-binding protein, partial [Oscillospiraceae bacterium]|nr:ABC transporter ATP-binding protein [Oscillospiraceae bacterium]
MSKSSQAPIRRGGGHGPGGMMPGSKAKNFKGSLLKLIRHLSPYKVSMIIVIIFATLSAVFSIIAPKIIGEATSSLFSVTLGVAIDFTYIGKLALWLIAIYLLSSSFMLVQGYVIAG